MSAATGNVVNFRENMGTDADWEKYALDVQLRRQAIIRNVWLLNSEEIPWITNIFLKKGTATEINDFFNEDHEYKDRLEFNKKLWDIEYIDMSRQTILDNVEVRSSEEFLLSFRENARENILIVIIKRLKHGATAKDYIRSITHTY